MIATPHQMPTDTEACPEDATLSAYLHGDLPRGAFDQASRHLIDCSSCRQRVENLPGEDSFVVRFSKLADTEFLDEADLSAALFSTAVIAERGRGFSDVLPPVDSIGPYDLVRPLGQGGMGAVYLARHRHLDRTCAIKLLPRSPGRPSRDDDHLERFRREMKSLASVDHPNIVAATDGGCEGGWHYLVMQYIDGVDVDRVLAQRDCLPLEQACQIGVEVCSALSALHLSGLVHRDIKPSNVMLTHDAAVKLLDFGLATPDASLATDHERLTTVGDIVGTLAYASPEQLAGQSTDFRSDLYSMGAMLYRMIAGRPPHQQSNGDGVAAMIMAKGSQDPPALSSPIESVPEPLGELIHQLLQRDTTLRPASADDVRQRLQPFAQPDSLRGLAIRSNPRGIERTVSAPARPSKPADSESSSRPWKRWLAGVLFALALAGVLFQFTTNRGTLVVRSDRDDLTVRVDKIDDGETVQSFHMTGNQHQTAITSGRYRVYFDGPVDDVEFIPVDVTVSRDAVAVALATPQPAATTTDPKLDATYKGKTVREYVRQLEKELDIDEIKNATNAILRVMDEDDVELAKVIFQPARRFGGWIQGTDDPSGQYMKNFADQAKQLPRIAGAEAIIHEIRKGNEKSRAAALSAVLFRPDPFAGVSTDIFDRWFNATNEYQAQFPTSPDEISALPQTSSMNVGYARRLLMDHIVQRNGDAKQILKIEEWLKAKMASDSVKNEPRVAIIPKMLDQLEQRSDPQNRNFADHAETGRIEITREQMETYFLNASISLDEFEIALKLDLDVSSSEIFQLSDFYGGESSFGSTLNQWLSRQPDSVQRDVANAYVHWASKLIVRWRQTESETSNSLLTRNVGDFWFGKKIIVDEGFTHFDPAEHRILASHKVWLPQLNLIANTTAYPKTLKRALQAIIPLTTPEEVATWKQRSSGTMGGFNAGGGGFGGGGFGGGGMGGMAPPVTVTEEDRQTSAQIQQQLQAAIESL